MSYARGWNKGLKEGLFGSGFLLGTVVPIALTLLLFIAAGVGISRCFKKEPGTCTNYSYDVGYLDRRDGVCSRWPAMKMRREDRWVKPDIIHCTCTEDSFPKRKP